MTSVSGEPEDREIVVHVDSELEDLIPGFLSNRRRDVVALQTALDGGDYEAIRILGHSMKGSGGGYGFDAITDIGRSLEETAREKDPGLVRKHIGELSHYLRHIKVAYE